MATVENYEYWVRVTPTYYSHPCCKAHSHCEWFNSEEEREAYLKANPKMYVLDMGCQPNTKTLAEINKALAGMPHLPQRGELDRCTDTNILR